jgi:putative transposase
VDGDVKQVHIKRERSGKWFACFSVEVEEVPKVEKFPEPVGIDLGIEHYAADTNGNFVEHPHNIAKSERRLKRERRRLSRKENKSKNRAKQRFKLALVHERIRNQRRDFHKLSHDYVSRYDFIAVENLGVKELIEMTHNGKNRTDAAWATFLHMLTYKAERAGRWVVKVEPRGTTDRCSRCSEVVEKPLWVRVHRCPGCGLELDRDLNAARNILQDGLKQIGWEPAEFAPVEIGPLSPAGTSSVIEAGSPVL